MLLYVGLFVGALAVLCLVIRYDMYAREPWWMLLVAIGLGGLMMRCSFALISQIIILRPKIYYGYRARDTGRDVLGTGKIKGRRAVFAARPPAVQQSYERAHLRAHGWFGGGSA